MLQAVDMALRHVLNPSAVQFNSPPWSTPFSRHLRYFNELTVTDVSGGATDLLLLPLPSCQEYVSKSVLCHLRHWINCDIDEPRILYWNSPSPGL